MAAIISLAQLVKRDPAQLGQLLDGGNEVKAVSLDLPAHSLSLGEAIHTRQFQAICVVFGSIWFSAIAITVHIVIHAIDLGIPAGRAANILAIIGGAGTIGRVMIDSAADRIGHKPVLIMGFTLMIISILQLLVTRELWSFYLFAVIFGLGFSSVVVLEVPLMTKIFGLGSLSTIMGTIEFVSATLATPSSTVAGYIFDVMGSYQLALLLLAGIGITGHMLSLLLKPTNNR